MIIIKNIFKFCCSIIYNYSLYIKNFICGHYFSSKGFLYLNAIIHLSFAFFIGGLESSYLDNTQIVVNLFIFFLFMYLNFQFFSYYTKEKFNRILKSKPSKLKYRVFHEKLYTFTPWMLSNTKFSLFIFVIGCFYNKVLIPDLVSISNIDPDFELTILLIFFTAAPQILIISYFLNSTGLLEKFYFFFYLITLRWILIITIILFVYGYNLELSSFLLLLLSTGLLSIFSEMEIFISANIIIQTLFSKVMNYLIYCIEEILDNYGKLMCSYWDGALASCKLLKFGHNFKIPFFLKKEVIDSQIKLKIRIGNIVIVKAQVPNNIASRYVPSIIDFNTKKIIISRVILEVINCNKKFCSYKLLGGASSSYSNLNSLIFPSEPLLLGNQTLPVNQTYYQYLVGGRDSGIFSKKFVELFLNDQYRPFNRYKNLIINDENKYILSLFAPLFIEQENNLFCFGVNIGGYLVPISYKKIFYNDKPNLSLYKLIGIFDNEGDMIRESDLYINQNNADHWVSGYQGSVWKSYSHLEELENFPTCFSKKTFSSLIVVKRGRYTNYDPNDQEHERIVLRLLIDGKFSQLPFESPRYFNVNTLNSFYAWKHSDKIRSFFDTSNNLRTLEE